METGVGRLSGVRFILPVGVAVVLAFALVSCGHDEKLPTAPSTPAGPSTTPTPPTVSLQRLELTVPSSIAPGESVQLRANAVMSDGSAQDVTSLAQWSSGDRRTLDVAASGVARGLATGEAFIFVRYQTRSASTSLAVLPTGTFRLRGTVTDDGQPLANATVTVIGGVGEGARNVTVSSGGYVLYGVAGHIRLQVKRDGYVNFLPELDVMEHRTADFTMTLDHPREQLGGRYTLTIGGRCAAGSLQGADLPRTYDATVNQSGPRLDVILGGADFVVTGGRGNHFAGSIDGTNRVTLLIGDTTSYYYYSYSGQYDVVERLTGASVLVANGILTATASPSRISGSLAGYISVARGIAPPFVQFDSRCYSSSHPFEMVRR